MSSIENGRVLFDAGASNLAFRVGQLVEELLFDRAEKLAQASHISIVTIDRVEACIDESLIEELRKRLNASRKPESRRAA